MRARIRELACGNRRNVVDVMATLGTDRRWVFDRPIQVVNAREDVVTWYAVSDTNVLHKTLEAPATAGASVVGGA